MKHRRPPVPAAGAPVLSAPAPVLPAAPAPVLPGPASGPAVRPAVGSVLLRRVHHIVWLGLIISVRVVPGVRAVPGVRVAVTVRVVIRVRVVVRLVRVLVIVVVGVPAVTRTVGVRPPTVPAATPGLTLVPGLPGPVPGVRPGRPKPRAARRGTRPPARGPTAPRRPLARPAVSPSRVPGFAGPGPALPLVRVPGVGPLGIPLRTRAPSVPSLRPRTPGRGAAGRRLTSGLPAEHALKLRAAVFTDGPSLFLRIAYIFEFMLHVAPLTGVLSTPAIRRPGGAASWLPQDASAVARHHQLTGWWAHSPC